MIINHLLNGMILQVWLFWLIHQQPPCPYPLSSDQKPGRLLRGWNPTQLYEDSFKSHWKDPVINHQDAYISARGSQGKPLPLCHRERGSCPKSPSLKLTTKAPEKWCSWNMIVSFGIFHIFRGELLVSGSVYPQLSQKSGLSQMTIKRISRKKPRRGLYFSWPTQKLSPSWNTRTNNIANHFHEKNTPRKIHIEPENDGLVQMIFLYRGGV